ncbi:uncharacterized protein PV09_04753 [Verruconis gallopava]|uniref:Isochorismatase-like domain-containing protein n=1 Tax=Verruconis gallopava TaxID=253628 RepID=A0A0D2ABI0_9PEZI|nr:uncharacterized protein PV09_04753 [Verruconis gallopava]KIW03910.1 hypothetical protein PV09_04753 [Verruconis gallopava]
MATKIDAKKTSLLLLDLQNGFLSRLPADASAAVVASTASTTSTARQHGITVTYVHAALTADEIAAIPDHNATFAAIKASSEISAAMAPDAAATQIHAALAPAPGERLHRKIRYGTFMTGPSTAILDDFRARGIDTVILGGIVTSGAVLSAVRQLADLDFRLFVLEDCCADYDQDVHNVLVQKVLPKQATVIKSADLAGLL